MSRPSYSKLLPAGWSGWFVLAAAAFFSLLPDMDAAPGLLFGDLGRYHNNLTHSVFFAVIVGLSSASVCKLLRCKRALFWGLFCSSAYGMHVLMDFFTHGRGVMLFWPFTKMRFRPPVDLFYGLHYSDGILSQRHLWTILTEGLFALLIVALTHSIIRRKRTAGVDQNARL